MRVKVNHKIPHGDGRVKIGKPIIKDLVFWTKIFFFFFRFWKTQKNQTQQELKENLKPLEIKYLIQFPFKLHIKRINSFRTIFLTLILSRSTNIFIYIVLLKNKTRFSKKKIKNNKTDLFFHQNNSSLFFPIRWVSSQQYHNSNPFHPPQLITPQQPVKTKIIKTIKIIIPKISQMFAKILLLPPLVPNPYKPLLVDVLYHLFQSKYP